MMEQGYTMIDLWPEKISYTKKKTPLIILKEQAALLGKKTNNIVTASVETTNDEVSNYFNHFFYLEAPALSYYRYQLFWIAHDVLLYPVQFYLDEHIHVEYRKIFLSKVVIRKPEVQADTEDEFLETLKFIFQSERTLQVIEAIMVQSEDYTTN